MTPSDFLRLLWGDQPPGLIQIWALEDKRSHYLRSPDAGDYYAADKADVYTAVATCARDLGRSRRATMNELTGLAGLWLDIDVNGGPESKTGAAPNTNAGQALAREVTQPTILVHSGHGLHAWWLFDEPWRFKTIEERRGAQITAAQWQQLHRHAAQGRGWDLDRTHDLTRLLRLPGTLNAKGQPAKPVKIVFDSPRRYPREQLSEFAAQAGPVEAQLPLPGGPPVEIQVREDAAPPAEKLEAMLANSELFADTWNHQRADAAGWSLSEYDLSLASQAAQAEFTDQEIADLIAAHRRRYGDLDKATRADYLRRTISKARAGGGSSAAATKLRDLAREAA